MQENATQSDRRKEESLFVCYGYTQVFPSESQNSSYVIHTDSFPSWVQTYLETVIELHHELSDILWYRTQDT